MEYVESNDTELKPSDEMLDAPSGKELCDYQGGRYPVSAAGAHISLLSLLLCVVKEEICVLLIAVAIWDFGYSDVEARMGDDTAVKDEEDVRRAAGEENRQ